MRKPTCLEGRLRAAKLVMFDCDGVLLQSNQVKTDAIAEVFADLSESLRLTCIDTFKRNFGQARDRHFHRFADLLNVAAEMRATFVQQRSDRYRDLVALRYTRVPAVPGALALCEGLHAAGRATCVITGGVASEAAAALSANGFGPLAQAVHGAPVGKAAHIMAQLAEHAISPAQAVYLGDAPSDLEACIETGVPFIYVRDHAIGEMSPIADRSVAAGIFAEWVPDLQARRVLSPLAVSHDQFEVSLNG